MINHNPLTGCIRRQPDRKVKPKTMKSIIITLIKTAACVCCICVTLLSAALAYIWNTDVIDPHPVWGMGMTLVAIITFCLGMAFAMWDDLFGTENENRNTNL